MAKEPYWPAIEELREQLSNLQKQHEAVVLWAAQNRRLIEGIAEKLQIHPEGYNWEPRYVDGKEEGS